MRSPQSWSHRFCTRKPSALPIQSHLWFANTCFSAALVQTEQTWFSMSAGRVHSCLQSLARCCKSDAFSPASIDLLTVRCSGHVASSSANLLPAFSSPVQGSQLCQTGVQSHQAWGQSSRGLRVPVQGLAFDRAVKQLQRKLQAENFREAYRDRQTYVKPCHQRLLARKESAARHQKRLFRYKMNWAMWKRSQ